MKPASKLLIGAVSALAITILPLKLELAASGSFEPLSAFAKGGGNGGGGGHGGGKGGEHGKSGDAHGQGKSHGGQRVGPQSPRLFDMVGEAGGKRKGADRKVAKSEAKARRNLEVAALPDTVLVPEAKPKDKNFHARLAGLNSLQRNYHAYLTSQSPRFAAVFDFVMDSATGVIGIDDEALEQALLAAANQNRVDQYGDDYIDDETLAWAKDVLGVGDDFGKIDEVRETLEIDEQ